MADSRRLRSREAVIRTISENPRPLTASEIVETVKYSEVTVYRRLSRLTDEGVLEKEFRPDGTLGRPPAYYSVSESDGSNG